MKQQELKPASINHALNTLRAFYQLLCRSNGYPVNQPLPTDAIGLERVEEPQALHVDKEDLVDIWYALSTDEPTRIRDHAIIALLSHGLRASELSVLNVNHWNGKRLTVHHLKGQNVSEVPVVLKRKGWENRNIAIESCIMSLALPHCPSCHAEAVVKNGRTRHGKQNYNCRECGRQFVEDPQWRPISDKTKGIVERLL